MHKTDAQRAWYDDRQRWVTRETRRLTEARGVVLTREEAASLARLSHNYAMGAGRASVRAWFVALFTARGVNANVRLTY